MEIKTRLIEVETNPVSPFDYGLGRTIRPQRSTLVFNSDDEQIKVSVSHQSRLYEHLELFAGKYGIDANFTFDICGENVNSYFQDRIDTLRSEKSAADKKYSALARIAETRLNIIIDQQTSVNELQFLKNKWWYKFFIYFK